ncbi:2-hydroxy-3-oxopropionate reductase [Streptomyces violaceorubidus]
MVGGEQADFDEAKPLLEALGKTIVLCGPHGSGQTVKAANQLIVAVNIAGVRRGRGLPWRSPAWT